MTRRERSDDDDPDTVDVELLRSEIKKAYTEASTAPAKGFIFPTGRAWAQDLGYPEPELTIVPEATVETSPESPTPSRWGA